MKKISTLFSSIMIAGMMLLVASPAFAQPFCGSNGVSPSLTSQGTDPLPPTPTNFLSGQYLAQSFVATQPNSTGAAIVVPPGFGDGAESFTISLVDGLPSAAGAVLASGSTGPIPAGGGVTATANWPITDVVVGNPYHIVIESTGLTLGFFTTTTINPLVDEYPDGTQWLGNPPIVFSLPFDIYFEIEYCADVIIPTMGQWGLILLSLLLLSFGTVQVLRRQAVLSGSTGMQNSNVRMSGIGSVPFFAGLYTKALWMAGFVFAAIFSVAIFGFGYEWMKADFMGIVLTLPVLAYLIHLMLAQKEES